MADTSARVPRVVTAVVVANLVVQIGIVVTGGLVRLTGSGLGCPTWPRCTDESYVPHGALDVHEAIEFGNRMLTFVLVGIAVACWLAAGARRRQDPVGGRLPFRLATTVALGIPAQAVIGGVTVLTDLNPWIVAFHLLVSMVIIGACTWLVRDVSGPAPARSTPELRRLSWLVLASGWLVLHLGTVVTGSGPHAGDEDAPRTGLDPQVFSHVHAVAVYLLVALTVGLLVQAHRQRATEVRRAAAVLLGVEVGQGVVGFTQYFLDLPVLLVALHLVGAALTAAALAWVLLAAQLPVSPAGTVQRVSSGSSATATNSSDR
jgi:cytochrome c oxidase assembly protein subunit 15